MELLNYFLLGAWTSTVALTFITRSKLWLVMSLLQLSAWLLTFYFMYQ